MCISLPRSPIGRVASRSSRLDRPFPRSAGDMTSDTVMCSDRYLADRVACFHGVSRVSQLSGSGMFRPGVLRRILYRG